jgi:hypothetical protein
VPRATASVLVLASLLAPGSGRAEEPPPSITVTGSGEVRAAPDRADVTAGVVSEASSAAEAVRANSAAMQSVLSALDELGIPKKQVQTQGFSVAPVYEEHSGMRGAPRIAGYRVSNQVSVEVQGVERVGAVLDRLVAAGANELGGVAFSMGEPTPLLDEARRRAVADARRKAELYAAAAGARLGKLLRLDEAAGGVPIPMFRRGMMAAEAAVPVAPGELALEASVTVTYAIAP